MEFLTRSRSGSPTTRRTSASISTASIARSSLPAEDALGVALAAAFAAGASRSSMPSVPRRPPAEANAALTAAALMGMNNAWYPYVEMAGDEDLKTQRAELRMNAYATSGGVAKKKFEAYALAASIIGKCHFCVSSHYALAEEGRADDAAAARHRPHRCGRQRRGAGDRGRAGLAR